MQAQQAVLTAMGNSTITDLIPQEVEESGNQQENDLIKRCQSGDQQAMEQIVSQYQNQVYNIAYGMLRNSEDAQDIMQEVFLRVWDKIRQFQLKSCFSTWLYRIVKN